MCLSTKILERYDAEQGVQGADTAPGPAVRNLREYKQGKYVPAAQQIGVRGTMTDLHNKELMRQRQLPSPLSYYRSEASKYLSPAPEITLKGRPRLPFSEKDTTVPGPCEYNVAQDKPRVACRKLETNLTDHIKSLQKNPKPY